MNVIDRSYIYYQATKSICDTCLKQIDAKIIAENNSIYIVKHCPIHGEQRHILEDDAQYHLKKVLFDKPSTIHINETEVKNGCPYDCGLCQVHEQHTCIGLIEITDKCNMSCPLCYASSNNNGHHLPLETIEKMVDYFVSAEGGRAEILQISGGEPTLHPNILEILTMCKNKNIGHIMINTNGIRLSEDEDFVKSLAPFIGGFEIYLQFDALDDIVYEEMRQQKMLDIKMKAINNLSKYHIPTTLVCTVSEGINDNQLGKIINFGISSPCIRGVNFQPVARFGAYEKAEKDSLTVSGVLRKIEESTNKIIKADDFVPLPCNVERVAVTYLYKSGKSFTSIVRNRNIEKYVPFISNTFLFTIDDALAQGNAPTFGFCKCLDFLNDFKKIVPKEFLLWNKEKRVQYLNENTFRITVSSFVDKYNFDLKSMQKECVHVITPDLKRIPFSAYNMIHRGKENDI